MLKKILFPIDGNTNSDKALEMVKEFAEKHSAEVIILHAYYLPSTFHAQESSHYVYLEQVEDNLKNYGEKLLTQTAEKLSGFTVHQKLLKGPAGTGIIEVAHNEGVDLIIMSNRGLGSIKSALLHSVSNYVLHHAECPVMIVK